ncbi:hypothetical protein NKJ09_22815 [Mesorhizobium sp. M0189]|uniref:hypothetical protein n=1 Tax=Mesorhizobium sp. M0189 TaxID=2956909 RepID=UPI00333555BA
MKIRVLGAGWFGCSVGLSLIAGGHDVEIHESSGRIFNGASGNIPARLHLGAPHYPRSSVTQKACQEHQAEFLARYGQFTRSIPVNIYAVARDHSLIDFGTYTRILRDQVEFLTLYDPAEFGLTYVEGGVMLGERHIVVDDAKAFFAKELDGAIKFNTPIGEVDSNDYDLTVDCSFCANDGAGVDRYEPCLVVLLKGPTDKSVTIVDGPFPSLYVWNEDLGLSSLSSAKWTPFSKTCKTWGEAKALLDGLSAADIERQAQFMISDMAGFYPAVRDLYRVEDYRLSIRAMPLSGSDSRLVDVVRVGERALRVRAGKIDAVIQAERIIKGMIDG